MRETPSACTTLPLSALAALSDDEVQALIDLHRARSKREWRQARALIRVLAHRRGGRAP